MGESTLIETLSFSDYLGHPAYGSSDIRDMATSFRYWKWRKAQQRKESRALVVGSATHLMLEAITTDCHHKMDTGIKVYREGTSRTKGFEKFSLENKGILCVDETEHELCQRMVAAVLDEPEAMKYLQGAIVEPTIFAAYPGTSVLMKARPDYLHVEQGVTINFKTSNDATDDGFIRSVKEYAYDWQSGIHTDIVGAHFKKHFDEVHIVVEKADEGPCAVNIVTIDDDTMQFARSQYTQIIERIPQCEQQNNWPKKPVYLKSLTVPMYARRVAELA